MFGGDIKMALSSLRSSKWRSLLTVLGIIIGIVSVVTTVSIGEGVKQQAQQQISQRGEDIITVLPGTTVQRNAIGEITSLDPFVGQSSTVFSESDYDAVANTPGVVLTVPFGQVVGLAETKERSYPEARVIATTPGAPTVLSQPVEYGGFFSEDSRDNTAIIGKTVAEQLFGENVPTGKSLEVRDREFIVRGVFSEFPGATPLLAGADYNNAIFIPYHVGQELMGGSMHIYQMLAMSEDSESTEQTAEAIKTSLTKQRSDQEDFTILRQEESLAITNELIHSITNLVTAIAAISLLVGGIGIMNIMLVSVSERTQEIGVRKAVGASNRQILGQFMTEAAVLGICGGLLGVVFSVLANFLLRIFTNLQPVITLEIVGVAVSVALFVGLFFGMAPALKAAHKDPIDALRY
ncbi:MAG: ABC transporter permease [Candidatus Saccharibacteria bacterium]|nr:ABC transporter permease [Candidatus Saccharibacteria bacterium]